MPVWRYSLLLLALWIGGVGPVQAQLSDEARLSLITILPGDAVYSLFGHSALRVHDPVHNIDIAYNYGTFDFGNPVTFAFEFTYGKLDYMLSQPSYPRSVEVYWNIEGRPIIEQVLDLDAEQRNAVFQFLRHNALPENRTYRYDFFFDNCSTRIRDVLEDILGADVQFAPEQDTDLSFRRLLDPYLVERPFLNMGMDLGLGLPADRLATTRETVFLPLNLMEAFDRATVTQDGVTKPLVARTDTVRWSDERAALAPAWPWPSILFWGLLVIGLFVTWRDVRAGRTRPRRLDGVLFGIVGLIGWVIVFLWFVSLHTVTYQNLNLFWAWPTHLIVGWLLRRPAPPRWLQGYLLATFVVTTVFALAWFFLPQDLPAPLLPVVVLLAARSAVGGYVRPPKPTTATPATIPAEK